MDALGVDGQCEDGSVTRDWFTNGALGFTQVIADGSFCQTAQEAEQVRSIPVTSITLDNLRRFPVWEYDIEHECEEGHDETWVRPVTSLPVHSLMNRFVATKVRLANGQLVMATLHTMDLSNARKTAQFLHLFIERVGTKFGLARYFDSDYDTSGPLVLAAFLDLPPDEVFPISYDISAYAVGLPEVVRGQIPMEVEEQLDRDQLMALSVQRRTL